MGRLSINLTRDSVAAGDDADAPHPLIIEVELTDTVNRVLERILQLEYLPQIGGGEATWSVASNQPIAVVAQQWTAPRLIYPMENDTCQDLNLRSLHFNYHVQENPETVLRVLNRFRTPLR